MLSETYSVDDVKIELENDYEFFGFASDALFKAKIERVGDDVMLRYFYPRIGETEYETIQAKDKVSLTLNQTYLYWAEVHTVCLEFIQDKSAVNGTLQNSSEESLTVEGYQHRISGGSSSGTSPGDEALKAYRDKAFEYWILAGFNLSALERTCTIFGSSDDSDVDDIIL